MAKKSIENELKGWPSDLENIVLPKNLYVRLKTIKGSELEKYDVELKDDRLKFHNIQIRCKQ